MKSHYDVLGVAVTATQEQIVTAYRLRSKVLHPDRFNPVKQRGEWELANELVKELNAAYAVLRDPTTRAAYDRANGLSQTSGTAQTARPSASRSQTTQRAPPPRPPPQRPSVVPPLSAGYALYRMLPKALQDRMRGRCAGKISPQFRARTGGVIIAYVLLAVVIWGAALSLRSAGTERWDSETTSNAGFTIVLGFAVSAYSLFRIVRWHFSPLKQYLIVTPLYLIETQFDQLWYWPLWRVRGLSGTHRSYNGIYYGTDAVFTFENGKRTYRFRRESAYSAVVDAFRVFSEKALLAEKQGDLEYFAHEDDFAALKRVDPAKHYRWKLATATTAIAGVAALVFCAAIFTINSAAPKPKPVRLGTTSNTYSPTGPSSSATASVLDPSAASPVQDAEPPYDPSVEPVNGYVFKNNLWRGGHGSLTIKNGTSSGAIVKLISTRLNSSVFTVFVAPNSDYAIRNIPNETYRLAYATGRRFNPLSDTSDRLYGVSVFDQLLTYDTQNRYEGDSVYTYYHQFEVTLQPVVGGTARTSPLAAQSFEQF
jgi:hypothetical protein